MAGAPGGHLDAQCTEAVLAKHAALLK